ncbi:MAG: tRNA (guanosine(37)-N1)-methyltransferase TrmD [Campylobacterales bacterium]|nr:tRNA (guanosine(37)-N1)-methyltransferase TrmD [Campylobacterales bacterium]
MKFSFVTLFPELIRPYFQESILNKALQSNLIEIDFLNPRDYTTNKHKKVDDTLCGGGAGQLISPQPMFDLLYEMKLKDREIHIVFPLAAAKPFKQNDAIRLAKTKKHIVFVSGRYEGIDERVIETFADEVFSIGDYILTGGELASCVMSDAISRNIEGVLGNSDSLSEESYNLQGGTKATLEAPSFTKPENFCNLSVPSELLKGNHAKIRVLKSNLSRCKTKYFRPS